tara:strand:+ start:318 stop:926 length:609 start_codon:yes stop_codon:yes gene_type:complete
MKINLFTIFLLLFSTQIFAKACEGTDISKWNNCYTYQFYESGRIYSKSFYKNGDKDGEDYRYFANGEVQSKGFYKNGKLEGKNISYDENGNILKEIFICKGNDTANWKNCTGILFADEAGQKNCKLSIYMNSKVFMGIKHKDIGFYAYPPCEMFVGEWKNGKQYGTGKYMYWITKDDGYYEVKYFSGTLLETKKKFSKEFSN